MSDMYILKGKTGVLEKYISLKDLLRQITNPTRQNDRQDIASQMVALSSVLSPDLSAVEVTESALKPIPVAMLKNAVLSETDLRDISLSGSNLQKARLCKCVLRGNDLSDTDLQDADLTDADLSQSNLQGANLSGANLSNANIQGSSLKGSKLSRCNFAGVNLKNMDFTDTDLDGADMTHAEIDASDLQGVDTRNLRLPPSIRLIINFVKDAESIVQDKEKEPSRVLVEDHGGESIETGLYTESACVNDTDVITTDPFREGEEPVARLSFGNEGKGHCFSCEGSEQTIDFSDASGKPIRNPYNRELIDKGQLRDFANSEQCLQWRADNHDGMAIEQGHYTLELDETGDLASNCANDVDKITWEEFVDGEPVAKLPSGTEEKDNCLGCKGAEHLVSYSDAEHEPVRSPYTQDILNKRQLREFANSQACTDAKTEHDTDTEHDTYQDLIQELLSPTVAHKKPTDKELLEEILSDTTSLAPGHDLISATIARTKENNTAALPLTPDNHVLWTRIKSA